MPSCVSCGKYFDSFDLGLCPECKRMAKGEHLISIDEMFDIAAKYIMDNFEKYKDLIEACLKDKMNEWGQGTISSYYEMSKSEKNVLRGDSK